MKNITKVLLFIAFLLFWGPAFNQEVIKDYKSYPYWIEMMQDPNANFFETQKAFYQYWEGKEITKGSGYKPFKRWEYWMERQIKPDGTKPSTHRNIEALNSVTKSNLSTTEGEWLPLGPFTVPSGYNGYRGLGRVNGIAFHPTNADMIFVGAPSGGLWVTEDGGNTWTTHTDVLSTLGVSDVLVDHTNPSVIYIGTGDRDAGDAPGLGVWKSIDGGVTFQPSNIGMETSTVSKLIMHPDDNQIILAATGGGVYRSTDAGASWSRNVNGNFKDLVFKPGDPDVVYAATGGNFFKSTDNGVSFIQISNGLPGGSRAALGVSPANPEIVYFLITNSESFKGIYRSEDSGESFTTRSTYPNIMSWDCEGGDGGQAWYDLDISVDPTNENIIHAGGVNCFKSSDGGLTWQINSHWYGGCGVPSVHADLHVLEYNPVNNRLYAGNDGGIYWTDNGGTSWTEISNGMVISQAYKIGQSATNRDYVINGYQDNGSSTYIGDEWVNVGGGDGMECAFDPTDDRYSYSTIYYGSIDRHFNHNYDGQIAGSGVNGITESGGWVTPFLIDPFDGNIMYIGYKNIWRSKNVRANNTNSVQWSKISDQNVSDFDQMAISYSNSNILYASDGSKLFRTDNAKDETVNWTTLTNLLPSGQSITAIEASPVDENTVYIVQQNKVFKSTNKGVSWTELTGSLPDVAMNTIRYYRNSQEGLYLGTDIGVFYRDSFTEDWIQYSDGLPTAIRITELEIYYDEENAQNDVIRAGSYGRGLWESSLRITPPTANFSANQVLVPVGCPVDFVDYSQGVPYSWNWQFEGGTPATSTDANPQGIVWNTPGTYDVTLTVTNSMGNNTIIKENFIEVSNSLLPDASFTSDNHSFCTGETAIVRFTDQTTYCPVSWLWSFEPANVTFLEGTTANSQNPVVQINGDQHITVTLTATNSNGSSSYVKEDYIAIGGQTLPFTEQWDVPNMSASGWQVVNPDNAVTWDIYTVSIDGVPTNTARMNFFNYNVAPGRRDQLISPAITLENMPSALLSFNYSYIRRYAGITDSLLVWISTDCGTTWEKVAQYGEDGNGIFETAPVSLSEYIPTSSDDWCDGNGNPECKVIDLAQWLGHSNVKIMFETVHRRGNNLFIDDIVVSPSINADQNPIPSKELIVYPNPGNNIFLITTSKDIKNAEIQIFTSTGKLVYQQKLGNGNEWQIKTGELPSGLYLLKIRSNKATFDEKLIVK